MSANSGLVWVDPDEIVHCTPASRWTDVNQHEGRRDHPHAFHDRGYFREATRRGDILDGDWDVATLRFCELLEYKALSDHIKGTKCWDESDYAARAYQWIKSGSTSRGYTDSDTFLAERVVEIDRLIESIRKHGVHPSSGPHSHDATVDDISVNIARDGSMLFNNRGHHRLSIAKLVKVDRVPVQIVVRHLARAHWLR